MLLVSDLPSFWTAIWFLPPVAAIGLWVAWSDMKYMKIPNTAVMALAAVYVIVGPAAFGFDWMLYLWGMVLGLVTLVAGFVGSSLRAFGAGDAKFAAAMAPLFADSSPSLVFVLFAGCMIGAFAAHRAMRLVPPFRAATPDWASWTHRKFPMGLALSGCIGFYFLLGLLNSA